MSSEKILGKILNKIETMDSKIESMDNKIGIMDNKIESMDNKIGIMDNKIETMDAQLKENTAILHALEYSSKVHKAELDNLNIKVAKLLGNEEKIKRLENNLKNHDHNIVIKSKKANVC